ncbi:MAG: tRNA (adenosine(37)-N6)-threonylcarbamoyltransferase complex ATPase subunit type 1 TsaE [Clostridiales bacterium]|jgi:tRNA threonylcarbamoyladenosine biosynthesis protein TsaE|nr:tRNA (adenosine(37)-N6)-threonylcarbamoyltransferase complex ATPase subunit type 1 TsaE [Clostridiales bacterium]
MRYESFSTADTYECGRKVAQDAKKGDIFCLTGDLGAGKTVFAKGFGAGLGVVDEIVSPTFTIINVYNAASGQESPGQCLPLYHFDVYRLNPADMDDTGYDEYFYGQGVCLIEWAEIIKALIPPHAVWITIQKNAEQSYDYRVITIR